jgi:hypothetical protein
VTITKSFPNGSGLCGAKNYTFGPNLLARLDEDFDPPQYLDFSAGPGNAELTAQLH